MKTSDSISVKYRKDYKPSAFLINKVSLNFELFDDYAIVTARMMLQANPAAETSGALVLDGEELELQGIEVAGQKLVQEQYEVDSEQLTIWLSKIQGLDYQDTPFELVTKVKIYPAQNTSLKAYTCRVKSFALSVKLKGSAKLPIILIVPM